MSTPEWLDGGLLPGPGLVDLFAWPINKFSLPFEFLYVVLSVDTFKTIKL